VERPDKILLRLTTSLTDYSHYIAYQGLLTLSQQPLSAARYELLASSERTVGESRPSVLISQELADRLLAASGHTVEELLARAPQTQRDQGIYVRTGWTARLDIPAVQKEQAPVRHVLAYWPGEDVILDAEMIVVAAYYDGLGRLADGTLYPGANDNAGGVAAMLEIIRTLKKANFHPKRTILFVAWEGGERHQAADYAYFLQAQRGFAEAYQIVAGLELEGIGAGTGSSAVLGHTTSERLTEMLQKAARQVHTPLSTRDSGLHVDPQLWPAPSVKVPSVTISWASSDDLVHRPSDTPESLDVEKIAQVGRMVSLAVMAVANDPSY